MEPTAETPTDLIARTTRGAGWNYAAFAVNKGLTLVTTIVLSRLLEPEDFGLLAMALVVMTFLDVVNDFGIGAAVVRERDDPRVTSVAFTVNIVIGVVLTGAAAAAAPGLSVLFDEPDFTPVLLALAPTFLLSSIGSVQDARLRKKLDFRTRFAVEATRGFAKGAVSIVLAVAGFGVWSLVWGQIVTIGLGALLYLRLDTWRPRLAYDGPTARRILGFGGPLAVVGVLGLVYKNLDYVFIGRRLDTAAVGVYSIAFRLPDLLVMSALYVLSAVAFPAYVHRSDDPEGLSRALLRSARLLAAVTVPVGIGLSLVAPDLIEVAFGTDWVEAGPALRYLGLYAATTSILFTAGDAYKAMGRPGLLVWLNVAKIALAAPALYVAAGYDLERVAAAQLAVALVVLVIRCVLSTVVLPVSFADQLRSIAPVGVAALAMAGVVLGLDRALSEWSTPARLLTMSAAGAAVYAAALVIVARDWCMDTMRLLTDLRRGRTLETPT